MTAMSQAAWNLMPELATLISLSCRGSHEYVFHIPGVTTASQSAVKWVVLALERLLALGDEENNTTAQGTQPAQPCFLPALVALLLTAQLESYALCTIREMAHATDQYFPVTTTMGVRIYSSN